MSPSSPFSPTSLSPPLFHYMYLSHSTLTGSISQKFFAATFRFGAWAKLISLLLVPISHVASFDIYLIYVERSIPYIFEYVIYFLRLLIYAFHRRTKELTCSEGDSTSLLVFSLGTFLSGNARCFICMFHIFMANNIWGKHISRLSQGHTLATFSISVESKIKKILQFTRIVYIIYNVCKWNDSAASNLLVIKKRDDKKATAKKS